MCVPQNMKKHWKYGKRRNLNAEEMKECQEDLASAQEKRAYIQGYADCIQVLYHMGILKENKGLKWVEEMDVK